MTKKTRKMSELSKAEFKKEVHDAVKEGLDNGLGEEIVKCVEKSFIKCLENLYGVDLSNAEKQRNFANERSRTHAFVKDFLAFKKKVYMTIAGAVAIALASPFTTTIKSFFTG